MSPQLEQFVPSHVCLKCDGCCRFQGADSRWRPRYDKREFVDADDYVTTIVDCGKHLCRFLNKADSTCRIYADRPFECALYPFLLSRDEKGIDVYVHLACPYIQDMEQSVELKEYMTYLKQFFTKQETVDFLKNNKHLLGDYTPYLQEMLHVFKLEAVI